MSKLNFYLVGLTFGLGCAGQVPSKLENVSGLKERDMQNCPSSLRGAYTSSRNIPGGVEVTIIGRPSDADQIRQLAAEQARITGSTLAVEHTGHGTGTGRLGYCPIVHPGAYIHVEAVPNGARVFMTAHKPHDVATLQDTVRRRVIALGGTSS